MGIGVKRKKNPVETLIEQHQGPRCMSGIHKLNGIYFTVSSSFEYAFSEAISENDLWLFKLLADGEKVGGVVCVHACVHVCVHTCVHMCVGGHTWPKAENPWDGNVVIYKSCNLMPHTDAPLVNPGLDPFCQI